MIRMNRNHAMVTSVILASSLALAACAADEEDSNGVEGTASPEATEEGAGADDTTADEELVDPGDRESQEVGGPQPRLAVTHDSGVAVLDGTTLDVLDDFSAEGFVRVNAAGDGRHAFLTEGESFRLLDLGTWGEPHGDHNHYYTTDPLLTEISVDGDTPGHALAHEGTGALFFDGTGEIHLFDLADLNAEEELETTTAETEDAHHGVAVPLDGGGWLETIGDDDERSGARVLDEDGDELARTEDCPGVHGEAVAAGGEILLGCEDGVVIYANGDFAKISAGPEFARTGNLFASSESSVVLGDYREDQEEPMTEVALVDVEAQELTTVDVGTAYNFRSLARGPEGEALVLGEDGLLHIIDPDSGELVDQIEVLDEWTEPEEWQEPRPAISVSGDIAYITAPEQGQIHMVDLGTGELIQTADVDFEPNELAVADARPAAEAEEHEGDDDHDDHEHDDDGHDHDHDHDDHDHDHDD